MNDSLTSKPRRHATAAERAQWVEQFQQSNLSARDFALQHGLGLSTLQRWLRADPALAVAPSVFTEVKLAATSGRWAAEVQRPDGWIVRLAPEASQALLPHLLRPC